MPVERDLFVEIMASYPAGVAIVTTLDADGTPRGLTTTAVSSVSAEPPLLLVCVDLTSRTLPALRAGGRFVVNFLREGRSELARTFASKTEDKFEGVEWSPTAAGLPVLHEDALAWADSHLAYLLRDRGLNAEGESLRLVRLVLAIAARGSAIIVGRAAGFLLPPETTVHARVIAALESRGAYMAQELRLTRPEAVEEVRARDERRAVFLDTTLALDPNDLTAYDVVVNSDRLGVEGAAQFVGWAVRTKQMFVELAEPSEQRSLNTLDELTGA